MIGDKSIAMNGAEFHNILEAREIPGEKGLRLQRAPESLREKISEAGSRNMLSTTGAEIRFVLEGDKAEVVLSAGSGSAEVSLFIGDFCTAVNPSIGPEPTPITVTRMGHLESLDENISRQFAFSPRVCRLMLPHLAGDIRFHGITGDIRPPTADELPSRRMLAYGTSITHGSAASKPYLTYAAQTAYRLRADLINLGLGGACFCEPEMADHIAERRDWNFATLCLSTNMILHFSAEEFAQRTRYLIRRIAESDPARPVACITLIPLFADYGPGLAEQKATTHEYRQTLRDVVAELNLPNVTLFEGPELLGRWSGMAFDILHPNDYGMIEIAENLAKKLEPILEVRGL